MITVVAAVIERDGRYLICQRRRDDAFPLKWEFPGGKIHPGETPQQALVRELAEELGVSAAIGPEIFRTRHTYEEPATEVELYFFAAGLGLQEPRNLTFEQIQWAARETLESFDFLEADRELIKLLTAGKSALPRP
jgi:8-oxo-dGTP diphosphatase